MGFMDKAKQMAEQAQAKLEEAQRQFNEGQQQDPPAEPATEYDQHGRPVAAPDPGPPHGDPLAASIGGTAAKEPPAPPAPGVPAAADDPNHPSYAPPPLTSGDPLAG